MDWLGSFVEWQRFGFNFETLCAGIVILFTIVEAVLLLRQNRIIWRNRSGRSLSVDLFLFLPFLFASLFVYGLERHEGALAINGLLFIFTIPIAIGLAKFNGLSRRHIAVLFLCGCALLAMIVFPVKPLFYSLFAFANVVFLLFQLWELRRSPSVGMIDIHLVIFYGFINAAWTAYAWWFADWPLFAVTLVSTVILAGIAGLYYRKSGRLKQYIRLYKNIINLIKRLRVHEWGMSVHLDLQKCNAGLIRSPGDIKRFIVDLCRLLEMQRFGDAEVHRFGSGHKEGYTAIQKIYDSAIVVHFEEIENRAFLDIFSCKSFDEIGVEKFCEDFFGAKKGTVNVLARG